MFHRHLTGNAIEVADVENQTSNPPMAVSQTCAGKTVHDVEEEDKVLRELQATPERQPLPTRNACTTITHNQEGQVDFTPSQPVMKQ